VSLTSVVVGGDTSNLTINVTDKARPEAIKSVDMDNILVEEGSDTIYLNDSDDDDYGSSFVFLDQYGREMNEEKSGEFFAATNLKGTDFADYRFVVRATFKGNAGSFGLNNDTRVNNGTDNEYEIRYNGGFNKTATDEKPVYYGGSLVIAANENVIGSAKSGFSIKFEIVKYKTTGSDAGFDKAQAISSAKNEDLTIIDITAVRSFSIDDVNKFYVETLGTAFDTGKLASNEIGDITAPIGSDLPIGGTVDIGGTEANPDYQHEVKVKGTYNGQSVSIPGDYLSFSSGKLYFDGANAISINGDELKYSDLYDVKTAQYLRKDASDTVKAVVSYEVTSGAAIVVKTLDTISKSIAISDAAPEVTTIEGNDTWTVAPTQTAIGNLADIGGDDEYEVKFKDQYGVEIVPDSLTYRIASIVPNAAGYADNNFKVSGNDSSAVNINGAERGDTFVWIIKADNVTKEVKVTVVADTYANITGNVNNYLDTLVLDKPIPEGDEYGPDGLEAQRINGLE
jgi:hypothetical protein